MTVSKFQPRCLLLVLSALLLVCTNGLAQQEKNDEAKPRNPAREITKLKSRFGKQLLQLTEQYREAEAGTERDKVVANRREFEVEITNQVLELTRARDDANRNIRDLVWYINRTKGEARENVFTELITEYTDSERLTRLVTELGRGNRLSEQTETWLRQIIEKSSNEKVQAVATFELASYLEQVRELAAYSEDEEYLSERTEEQLNTEIESLLNQCQEKFADVATRNTTIGRLATAKLFAARIGVGKPAPEIEGVDLDGVAFKLSDYRGKVVMIDFWGDW